MLKLKIADVKRMFFDRAAVSGAVDKASLRVLSKFGAFVRTTARQSIRPARQTPIGELTEEQLTAYRRAVAIARKTGKPKPRRPMQSSKAGQPPRSHLGLLKRFIFFAYDPATNGVVIGPARLNGVAGGPAALAALEEGGTSRTPQGKTIRIDARPFMGPALKKEEPKLPALWANSVKGN